MVIFLSPKHAHSYQLKVSENVANQLSVLQAESVTFSLHKSILKPSIISKYSWDKNQNPYQWP